MRLLQETNNKIRLMNITFLLRLWPVYGGGETVTICLANEMIKRGWNVSVLYFKNNTRADLPFIDPAESILWQEGGGFGTPSGGLAFGENAG